MCSNFGRAQIKYILCGSRCHLHKNPIDKAQRNSCNDSNDYNNKHHREQFPIASIKCITTAVDETLPFDIDEQNVKGNRRRIP